MNAMTDDIDVIIADIQARAPANGKIVFVYGDFNILHPGHLRLFNFAASCGDFLVVGINADGRGNTLLPEAMRRDSVAAIGVVNYTLVLSTAPEDFVARLRPAVMVKGREHSEHHNTEQAVVESYGGKLLFSSGDIGFSSMDLLRREFRETNLANIIKPLDYLKRHGFNFSDLMGIVRKFAGLRVIVVGDLIVDEYIDCEPLGMSREDPTLVISPLNSEKFVGGAGIVAAHACGMGASVAYYGVAGGDATQFFAEETLKSYGVDCRLIRDDTRPTTLKQRFRASNKTLLRVSHLRQHDISTELVDVMCAQIEAALPGANLLVFSDFNYGCLPQELIDRISARCQALRIPMVADSQASSQISDVSRFHGMKLLTPTEHEARLAVRDFQAGLVVLGDVLRDKAGAEHILITLAAEGVLVHSPGQTEGLITDRLPAFNSSPRDVSGAGDSLFTCAAMALASGADIWRSAYLGCVAAACQVSRIGNLPLKAEELLAELAL